MDTKLIIAVIGIFGAIIGVYVWVARHISARKKHPCIDDIVFEKTCEERSKANIQAHEHLKEGITMAIARSDEQHVALKKDMWRGFDEVKELIRNGGK